MQRGVSYTSSESGALDWAFPPTRNLRFQFPSSWGDRLMWLTAPGGERVTVFILGYSTNCEGLRVKALATPLLLRRDIHRAFTAYPCPAWRALCSSSICPIFRHIYILPPPPSLSLSLPRNEGLFSQPAHRDHLSLFSSLEILRTSQNH